jgi:hypothetical protein
MLIPPAVGPGELTLNVQAPAHVRPGGRILLKADVSGEGSPPVFTVGRYVHRAGCRPKASAPARCFHRMRATVDLAPTPFEITVTAPKTPGRLIMRVHVKADVTHHVSKLVRVRIG